MRWKKPSSAAAERPASGAEAAPARTAIGRYQETAVYLLVLGTLTLVTTTDHLSSASLMVCLLIIAARVLGLSLSTNAGCALLLCVAAGAPVYWFFFRSLERFGLKDFLLSVLMVFLLSAKSGRDYAAVSVYCIWIMMASLFPSSGPQQWILLASLFAWFLVVQSFNELRRSREQSQAWTGLDGTLLLRPLAGFSLLLLLAIGGFSTALYVLFPRNPIAAFQFNFQPLRRLVGFSNSVRLGQIGEIQDDRTPAFRVRFLNGQAPPVIRWRGAALADFSGHSWTNNRETWSEFSLDNRVNLASDDQRRLPGPRLFYEVQTLALMDRVLFSTGVPEYVFLPNGRLRSSSEGGLRQISLESALPSYSLSAYIAEAYDAHPRSSDSNQVLTPERRGRYLRLPELSPEVRELAPRLVGRGQDHYTAAIQLENYLRNNFSYSLDARIGGATPLSDFLFVTRSGHCEYFASALAVMLRSIGIPSRVATGFYGRLPEPVDNWYVIRSSNAHSWVEAWIEGRGWVIFDPTPSNPNNKPPTALALWVQRMQDRFVVMGEEWFGGNGGIRRPSLPQFQPDFRYLGIPAVGLLIYALYRLVPRPGPRPREATRLYQRYLRAAGMTARPDLTPREAARKLAAKPLAEEIRACYEEARYARREGALGELKRLVAQFEKQVV